MTDVPTAILLFTDIVGSTGMWDRDADAMDRAMTAHDRILHSSITAHGGAVFKHTGDGICAVFDDAAESMQAAIRGQKLLAAVAWPAPTGPHVRMALHAGGFREHSGDYFGLDVCPARRILELTPGGSVLVTEPLVALFDEAPLNHLCWWPSDTATTRRPCGRQRSNSEEPQKEGNHEETDDDPGSPDAADGVSGCGRSEKGAVRPGPKTRGLHVRAGRLQPPLHTHGVIGWQRTRMLRLSSCRAMGVPKTAA